MPIYMQVFSTVLELTGKLFFEEESKTKSQIIETNAHFQLEAAFTAFSAASSRSSAVMIVMPLSCKEIKFIVDTSRIFQITRCFKGLLK